MNSLLFPYNPPVCESIDKWRFFYSYCWQVQLNMTKQSVDSQGTDEMTVFKTLASEIVQGNVLLYGIQIDHSKVIFLMRYHYMCWRDSSPKIWNCSFVYMSSKPYFGLDKRSRNIQDEPCLKTWSEGLKHVSFREFIKNLHYIFVIVAPGKKKIMENDVWICPVWLRPPLKTLRQRREWL